MWPFVADADPLSSVDEDDVDGVGGVVGGVDELDEVDEVDEVDAVDCFAAGEGESKGSGSEADSPASPEVDFSRGALRVGPGSGLR